MTRVAVIGNTPRNLGVVCAADLTLAGHQVRYAVFPEQAAQLVPVKERGGFQLEGNPDQLVSKRTGFAKLHGIHDDPADALDDAEVVLIDSPMPALPARFRALIPRLPRDAVVHVQSHGYWPAAWLTPLLRAAGRDDVLVTEAAAPTSAAGLAGAVVTAKTLRRGIEIATMPGARIDFALARLKTLFPDFAAAPSVLQTGLENANLMVHPAMILLGIGLIEQAGLKGEGLRFYNVCNVPSAGTLGDALDAERAKVCAAYGVRHKPVAAHIDTYYGTTGKNAYDGVGGCAFYQGLGSYPSTIWRDWESIDVPYAIVPLVWLAEQAGLKAPLHRAMAEILGTLLGMDPWNAGPTLADMDLVGSPAAVMQRVRGKG
jgi:opine dehydrogenase